jgi:hypothetical protein
MQILKRTSILSTTFVSLLMITVSSCSSENSFEVIKEGTETHTVFNIVVSKNTKTKSRTKAKDSKTTADTEKSHATLDSNIAFGFIGKDNAADKVEVENLPVYENKGVRSADVITSLNSDDKIQVSAYYPYVKEVTHQIDGTHVIEFGKDEIQQGPLVTNTISMNCSVEHEIVNLEFHHIANQIGFKVCDITEDEQLRGYMHVRKVIVHGMASEGVFVVDGENSHWVPQAECDSVVIFEGSDAVRYGLDNARFIGKSSLSTNSADATRFYVVPELLRADKHYVEVIFDVDGFVYDGTRYRGVTEKKQIIPLEGVVPDDFFELGLQYTFILGMNLGTVYRTIEFSALVDNWENRFDGRVLDYDNE